MIYPFNVSAQCLRAFSFCALLGPRGQTPKAPEDVAGSSVVLPEGPGEAAPGTPTEAAADDMPAPVRDTLKDESQCASPSL